MLRASYNTNIKTSTGQAYDDPSCNYCIVCVSPCDGICGAILEVELGSETTLDIITRREESLRYSKLTLIPTTIRQCLTI
jgi:hypothetical protein